MIVTPVSGMSATLPHAFEKLKALRLARIQGSGGNATPGRAIPDRCHHREAFEAAPLLWTESFSSSVTPLGVLPTRPCAVRAGCHSMRRPASARHRGGGVLDS